MWTEHLTGILVFSMILHLQAEGKLHKYKPLKTCILLIVKVQMYFFKRSIVHTAQQ